MNTDSGCCFVGGIVDGGDDVDDVDVCGSDVGVGVCMVAVVTDMLRCSGFFLFWALVGG